MDSSEPSCSAHNFKPDDLIWAKMKGFPPWPAKVLQRSEEAPARRIPVIFFGTLETSFMKPNDISDYLSNRSLYEIPRKHKDFNKAIQEIRKAAGLETELDEIQFPTVERKSPPSSPTTTGRRRQTSGRFLDAIMAGPDPIKMKGTRSGSASTKTRSRASSNGSASKVLRDMMRKERRRLNSGSSTGSKRKFLNHALLNGGAPSTSDAFNDYADSTDFNALFGDAILGNFELNDETKSWKSKRSRGSSKVFDDLFGRSRNRSGSASGRRSRMISLSGFSGVSDMFDELFNNQGNLDTQADQLMLTLNNMPSDGSMDRPLTPEMLNLNPMLQPAVEFCDLCGYECRYINGNWKCNSNHCGAIKILGDASMSASHGIIEEPKLEIKSEGLSDNSADQVVTSSDVLPSKRLRKRKRISDDEDSEDEDASRRSKALNKKKKKVQVLSPRSRTHSPAPENVPASTTILLGRSNSPTSTSHRIRDRARPKHYKVEKTPPISASGHRHCVNCNGQVRPQMCGGNRHRWRCVDKKCRKWYGWVRSHEEIPKNTGRKKMAAGIKTSAAKSMKAAKSKKEEEEEIVPLKRKVGRPSKHDIKIRLKLLKETDEKQASNSNRNSHMAAADATASSAIPPQPRRKYTKRKKDGLGGVSGNKSRDFSLMEDESMKRPTSPLSERAASYRPCAMEKRARWWTGEKRRVDASPERDLGTTPADAAAAFRMMAHAVRSAAVTRADEVGTVNGSLDLLMDSLLGSMGPLLANLTKLPAFQGDNELAQKLWNVSAVHIPTFQ